MNLKQLTLSQLKGLILRLWPGLAGFHVMRYAIVKKVYEKPGKDLPISPVMAVDLQFCKHDFSIDVRHKVKKKIRLAGGSEFVQAPPVEGTYVLIHFPYWLCNTATVLAVLYLDRKVSPEKDCYQIRDADKTKISAKTELILGDGDDQAVLGNELTTVLSNIIDKTEALGDQITALGAQDSTGSPCLSLPGVQTAVTGIKADLEIVKNMIADDILSDIKLGRGCDAAVV